MTVQLDEAYRPAPRSTHQSASRWAAAALAVVLGGCGDDDVKSSQDAGAILLDAGSLPTGSSHNNDADSGAPSALNPGMDSGLVDTSNALYAVSVQVLGELADNTYVSTLKTLDVQSVDNKQAIELGGRSTIASFGGYLYIGEAESPVIRRYTAGADGKLVEDADKRLDFSNQGLSNVVLDEWRNTFISATKAYLYDDTSGTHIIWNPSTMEISGEIAAEDLAREGYTLDGSPGFLRGNRLYRSVTWKNWDEYETKAEQYILVIDTDTDKIISRTADNRCPALTAQITRDEQGTLYFSNWVWNVAETLVRKAPKSCAIRILPGVDTPDPTWQLNYAELTGGLEGAGFAYVKGGKALLSVFDSTGLSFDATTEIGKVAQDTRWNLYTVDVAARTVAKVEGTPTFAGGYTQLQLDGRELAFFPADSYETTTVYELPESGAAQKRFELPGWAYQLVRIR